VKAEICEAALDDRIGDEALVLLHHRVFEAAADEALHREEGALRIGHGLTLGGDADETLAVVGHGDDRRRGARAFRVLDDLGGLAVHDGDARVGRAEVDTDHLTHDASPCQQAVRTPHSGIRDERSAHGPHVGDPAGSPVALENVARTAVSTTRALLRRGI
jgi:hypothetical protein